MVTESRWLDPQLLQLPGHKHMVGGAEIWQLGGMSRSSAVLMGHNPLVLARAPEPGHDHISAKGSTNKQSRLEVAQLQVEKLKVVLWGRSPFGLPQNQHRWRNLDIICYQLLRSVVCWRISPQKLFSGS